MGKPYQDKDTLYEMYHGRRMTKTEIGDDLGVSDVTIGNWMDRLGVPSARAEDRISFVGALYEQGATQAEIASRLGCDQTKISSVLLEHGMDTYDPNERKHPSVYFDQHGYLTCRHRDGESRKAFKIHRLVAVAEYGFDEVVGKEVHHKNRYRADNRHENLLPVSDDEHTALHHEQGDILPSSS